jgi:hypothetical protein
MKMTRIIAIALAAGVIGATFASAQIKEAVPAEFPPASYKGKQYVDSKGCVFIRAGIDGDVSWVPRVSRARKAICGFTPTLGAASAKAAPAPAKPAQKVEQITIAAAPEAPAPAPKPRAAAPAPAPKKPARVVRRAAPKVVRQTAPKRVVIRNPVVEAPTQAAPKVVVTSRVARPAATKPQQRATACPGASALSQRYLHGDGKSEVRCGPQNAPIVAGSYQQQQIATAAAPKRGLFQRRRTASTTKAPLTSNVSDQTRIVPKHVEASRQNTTNVTVPRGYRRVWDDGRLNPKRAEQNLTGRGQMALIWTNSVPRRLINQANGRDVTASVPLVYPYVDRATQARDLGEVTIMRRDGQLVKRIVRNPAVRRTKRQATLSTRSAPRAPTAAPKAVAAPKAAPAVGGKRYVQIGLFSTQAKARSAAQNLANMGMRAHLAAVRYKGKSYLSVKAGPFSGADATQNAVARLHGVGYTGAKARN